MSHEPSDTSYLALGRIDPEEEGGLERLESVASHWLRAMDQSKWPRVLQYFENASYLFGNHLTRYYYDATHGFGVSVMGHHDQNKYDTVVAKQPDNRLIRPVETVVGMLTQNKPMPRMEPNSELPEDEDAAELAQIVTRLVFERPLEMPRKRREAAMVLCLCGTAAIETEYGPTDIPQVVPKFKVVERENPFKDEPDQPDTIEDLEPDGTEVTVRNDLQAHVWTPFHLTPDPGATSPEDMSWIARSTFEDIDEIREQFDVDEEGYHPENLDQLREETGSQYALFWWSKIQDILPTPQSLHHGGGMSPQAWTGAGGSAPNQTLFTVIDVKPTRTYPQGRTIMMAGGKILYCAPKDVGARAWSEAYPWRWHPYSFSHWFKVPGQFWGIPLLSELVPLQKRINAIDARVKANRDYMSIGQWLLPKHAKVAEGRISGLSGEHYTYTDVPGMHAPEKVQNIGLPQELLVEREQLLQAIDYIAASSMVGDEVSKSAARAGVILDYLRQEKLRAKSPMLQDFEGMIEGVGQNALIEIQRHLREEDPELTRRIQVAAREHSSLTVEAFTGASLRDHHAIRIDVASELMHSPEALEAKALEFLSYRGQGALPSEIEAVMKAIKLDKFMKDDESASVKRARRMISRVIAGQKEAAMPMPGIDVASAMLPVFKREILSDRFHDHDKETKGLLVSLYDTYAQMAAQEMQQRMQMEMAMAQGQVKPEDSPVQEDAGASRAA